MKESGVDTAQRDLDFAVAENGTLGDSTLRNGRS
jgi:hypothetical protein